MKPLETLLSDGIQSLCEADTDIERIIVPRREEITAFLDRYVSEIELFNKAYGLVGTDKYEDLVIKHILDSIAPLGIIRRLLMAANGARGMDCSADEPEHTDLKIPSIKTRGYKIADAGSGAGLPGIPLAIALPECHFTLIERMGRRAGFLWNTKAVLGLSNITVEENELEKIAGGRFSLVTFRAFKPLEPKLLLTLFNACAEKGVIAAYKGRREKIEHEILKFANNKVQKQESISHFTPCFEYNFEIIPYNVPFLDEERHLLFIRKQ